VGSTGERNALTSFGMERGDEAAASYLLLGGSTG
jgi:hypothetical protein